MTKGTLTNDLINGNGNTYSQLAWNTYLIDPLYINNDLVDGQYISNFSSDSKTQYKNIRVLRPDGGGLKPKHFYKVIGKRFKRSLKKNQPLRLNMIK